jgi:hypothetical protein
MFVTYLAKAIDATQVHFRTRMVQTDRIDGWAISPSECWFMVPGTIED